MRESADKKLSEISTKMADHYNSNKKVVKFDVGEHVSLRIPWIDRTSSDLPRFPDIIVEARGQKQSLLPSNIYMYMNF